MALEKMTILNIATVPFSQLYDVLRSASREQLLIWAKALEKLPEGPKRNAAVTSYYKSLIQVNHAAALEAVLHAQNLGVRDVAIEALLKTAPESIWGEISEMLLRLPHPARGTFDEDTILNWGCVDPVAASKFIARNPVEGEDSRLTSLLPNWALVDPQAAKAWVEADASRQGEEAISALLDGFGMSDPTGAIDYVVANAGRQNFQKGMKSLAYSFMRYRHPESARSLIMRLSADEAEKAVEYIASESTAVFVDGDVNYQRPPEEVARWMATLPPNLWETHVGGLFDRWFREDSEGARAWIDQMPTGQRDVALANSIETGMDGSAEELVPLAFTITDPQLRTGALRGFIKTRGYDRANLRQKIEALPVTPAQQEILHRMMDEEWNE